jgi:hypothetical protein
MYVVDWFFFNFVTSVKMAARKSNALEGPSKYSCINFTDFNDKKQHVEVWWPHIHDAELYVLFAQPLIN